MGNVGTKSVKNATVWYDNASVSVSGGNRWYDAIGPGVSKYVTEFASLPADDSTTDPTEWVATVVEVGAGTSTATIGDVAGGALLVVTAANEDDGWSMQLGHANAGEWVKLDATTFTYFGTEFKINDVTQTDLFLGLAVTDTALTGGVTDGLYFRSADGSAVLNFVLEKDSVESSTAVDTMADNTYVTAEFFVDGPAGYVYAYIDGTLAATVAITDASFPNDENLRLSVELLTGEAVAQTMTMKNLRLIHIR